MSPPRQGHDPWPKLTYQCRDDDGGAQHDERQNGLAPQILIQQSRQPPAPMTAMLVNTAEVGGKMG